ncbi:hypothetical protein [Ruania rhizosphaerae]|uniref:hypothetical protein n=1 Tax=Ruania rhizosphaerae TaxID=1840413 RepID=UPI0013576132|nr:hypothetical protein [Ruania rhizosphaerae]
MASTVGPRNSYLTYPHANGFYGGGRCVALGVYGSQPWIAGVDLHGGASEALIGPEWFPQVGSGAVLWFDVALDAEVLVSSWGGRVIARDLHGTAVDVAYEVPPGWELDGLCSISRDGARVLIVRRRAGVSEILEIERGTGRSRLVVSHGWYANHAHYCPHDEAWVAYSHEGPAGSVSDRVWAWHATAAPGGVNVVDQFRLADPDGRAGGHVWLGHERWVFHDAAAVVVAYGDSPVGPRGVYLVHADGRAPVLVSRAVRDWHCGISRDGRAVVVDTTGLDGSPGRGWAGADGQSSVVHIDRATGVRTELARTQVRDHPFHPHPCFTPDGAAVLYNAVERAADGTVGRSVGSVAVPAASS